MSQKLKSHVPSDQRGKLRIGNEWNAITFISVAVKSTQSYRGVGRDLNRCSRNKFVGLAADQLLERMMELSLRTEENL